jgi:hypothetical protein
LIRAIKSTKKACYLLSQQRGSGWGFQMSESCIPCSIATDLSQTRLGFRLKCGIAATCLPPRHAAAAGQSACQAAPIVVIVVQTISDPAMHCVIFFSCHFYFSDSSPEAVE